jgi:Tol biopolymer transport system component
VDGGATRRVTNGPGHFWVHAWAPDNDHVAVARQKDGVWNVWAVSTATGTLRALTRYTRPSVHVRYPAWSPRGDQIVYEFGDVQGNVWVSRLP